MTVEVPANEPTELTLGETWQWRRTDLADYLASDGWSLKYYFRNATNYFNLVADTYDTDAYQVLESPSDQAALSPVPAAGKYDWHAYVEKGVGAALERRKVDEGVLTVVPNFTTAAVLDQRTHARKVLDAIRAVLENRATLDQEEMTIGSRSLKRTPLKDLLGLEKEYAARVRTEENREAVANGAAPKNRVTFKL
jgi:hypothetical protein